MAFGSRNSIKLLLLLSSSIVVSAFKNLITLQEGVQKDQFDWINDKGRYMEGKPWPQNFSFPLNYQGEFEVFWNQQP